MNKNYLDKKNRYYLKSNKIILNSLIDKNKYLKELEKSIKDITNSKAFNVWKKYQKIKKMLNPKTYLKYIKTRIKKYKYNLNDLETPRHGFIFLKTKTSKWKFDGYEKVGEDWHIRIIRKIDEKKFLLDQAFFYCLQIVENIDINKEMFITYGIDDINLVKIKKTLKSLNLC